VKATIGPGEQPRYPRRPLLRRKRHHPAPESTIALSGWFTSARSLPDADETSQTQQSKFPKTDVFSHIEVVDGRIWLRPEGTKFFLRRPFGAGAEARLGDPGRPETGPVRGESRGTAWKSKPSWYHSSASNDRHRSS